MYKPSQEGEAFDGSHEDDLSSKVNYGIGDGVKIQEYSNAKPSGLNSQDIQLGSSGIILQDSDRDLGAHQYQSMTQRENVTRAHRVAGVADDATLHHGNRVVQSHEKKFIAGKNASGASQVMKHHN